MKIFKKIALVISIIMISGAAAYAAPQPEYGKASHYSKGNSRKTSSGKRMDPNKDTCAHKTHPMGTKLKVTNPKNGKSVIVEVNDRGPFVKGRIVDLSYSAAEKIGMIGAGVTDVIVEVVDEDSDSPEAMDSTDQLNVIETPDAELTTVE